MKYCPYCGASLVGGAASFCAECGKKIPVRAEVPQSEPKTTGKTRIRERPTAPQRRRKPSPGPPNPAKRKKNPMDVNYDGYYDDVKPVDAGEQEERIDPELVKRIAILFLLWRGRRFMVPCFNGREWVERSGRICYDEPLPQFQKTKQNLEKLIEEVRRQVIYDDRQYEAKARALLKAFEDRDPDGVLLALSGRRLREHGAAAGIWQDDGEGNNPDTGE